jgi:type 1 glutamine amidotransferase
MLTRRQLLAATGTAAALSQLPLNWVGAADSRPRKLLVFTKSAGFEHSTIKREGDKLSHTENVITELGKKHSFEVTCTKDGRVFDSELGGYDAFFFYTTGVLTEAGTDKNPPMSADGKKRLFEAVKSGKGFLASHCGSDTFHKGEARKEQPVGERDEYIVMLGGEFISHGPQQNVTQTVVDSAFPGFKDVGKTWETNDEWYSLKNFADDMHVLMVVNTKGMQGKDYQRPNYPGTWARNYGKGRVWYTANGHREDVWTNETFQNIFLGGLSWAFGNTADVKLTPNIKDVAPEAHTMPPA